MQQDRIYRISVTPYKDLCVLLDDTDTGLVLYIFNDEPGPFTEPEHACITLKIEGEENPSPDVNRVVLRIWDDETSQEDLPKHILTLAEIEDDD